MTDILESAKSGKRRDGQMVLIKHLTGIRLTQRQAIRAKCYDCLGMGEQDTCNTLECPLHAFSQFRVGKV